MDPENDVAVSDELEMSADAEQEDVADSPVETETDETAEDEPEDEGAADEAGDAEAADPQPEKPKQGKTADSIAAAARKQAEQQRKAAEDKQRDIETQLQAERESKDAFARRCGYKDFADMERGEIVQRLKEQGMPEAAAQTMADLQRELADLKQAKTREQQERAQQEKWNALFRAYPETQKLEALPDRVHELMQQGESPLQAYRAYRLEALEAENTALKQNKDNKQKALGPIKSKGSPQKPDAFLSGLGG